MTRRATTLLILLATLLAACAPNTAPRLEIGSVPELTTFHPNQTGLERQYLYPNDALDAQTITHRVIGPMSERGTILTVEHAYGRGYDHHYYRSYTPDGVHLHREARPGVTSVRVSKTGKAIVDRALGDMKGLLELEGRNDG